MYSTPQTIEACEALCLSMNDCVGLDFKTVDASKCHIFTDIDKFDNVEGGVANIDHYKRIPCEGGK